MSWWCFPFEHLIGALQKVNTNDHIGGVMEATIIKTVTHTANICQRLHRSDCPEAVQQLKILFNKCFVLTNVASEENELQPMKGLQCAYAKWDGMNFSPGRTHAGNDTIIYHPLPTERPVSATSYASTLRENEDVISLNDIISHAACFDHLYNRTVLVNLSRD
ncbi:hypothetical protein GYMLUDRAFT_74769 [Collybiopsis luxurians FD-317 M1]|uniref:Uncharacterized protein n=1 Tax=Collybiopsis luxurians FD-317 M1 TaxID=944289 RepID=A0A0D0B5R3_9AGAR|nr:hypothetical protein GYMLUDRAFT_74769 [Collybiopsis luxurians FD-317 M1]